MLNRLFERPEACLNTMPAGLPAAHRSWKSAQIHPNNICSAASMLNCAQQQCYNFDIHARLAHALKLPPQSTRLHSNAVMLSSLTLEHLGE